MAIRKSFIVLAIFIFSIPAILADFQVEVAPVKDQIIINEYGVFNVTLKNYYDTEEEFKIRNFDYPVWDIFTEPLINPITIKVQPQSSGKLQIFVKSLQYAQTPVGTYALNARVDVETKGELTRAQTVILGAGFEHSWKCHPSVKPTADVAVDVNAKKAVSIFMKNILFNLK